MNRMKLGFALVLATGALLFASKIYAAGEGHRVLNVTVSEIKGETLFYKTPEGTTRNISLKIVEQYEKIDGVKVGDKLVMEFDEGNQMIRVNRPDRFTVLGEVTKWEAAERTVTLKRPGGDLETFTLIPPAAAKMSVIPVGSTVLLDIDMKNNFVKDVNRR